MKLMTQEQLSKQLKDWAEVKKIRKSKGIPELGPDDTIYDTEYMREIDQTKKSGVETVVVEI